MHIKELFDLTGKTAIVTGGGRGLGEQMATALAEAGANIVVCSRKLEACEAVKNQLEDTLGIKALALSCDITKPEDVSHVVEKTMEVFGHIDILVNNSGASWGASPLEMPIEAWHKVMEVNATGTFLMSQAVARQMVKQKSGKIINIASIAGLFGTDPDVLNAIGYNASKGAVINLTRDLAAKLGKDNINVNAIAPGFFPTKMTKVVIEHNENRILDFTPLGRFGSDDDLKGAVVYLASRASDFVSGHILSVDGGTAAI